MISLRILRISPLRLVQALRIDTGDLKAALFILDCSAISSIVTAHAKLLKNLILPKPAVEASAYEGALTCNIYKSN